MWAEEHGVAVAAQSQDRVLYYGGFTTSANHHLDSTTGTTSRVSTQRNEENFIRIVDINKLPLVGLRPPLPCPSLPKMCVSKKNTTSFWSQIPGRCETVMSDKEHICISLDDLTDDIMVHGTELSVMLMNGNKHNTSGINGCVAAKACLI